MVIHQGPYCNVWHEVVLGLHEVKGSVSSRQSSTCLVLHPWKDLCSSVSMGMSFNQSTPILDPGLRACDQILPCNRFPLPDHSLLLLDSSRAAFSPLASLVTRGALVKIRLLRSQNTREVNLETVLIFKSPSSRTCPIHLLARSVQNFREVGAVITSICCHQFVVPVPSLSESVFKALAAPHYLAYAHLGSTSAGQIFSP